MLRRKEGFPLDRVSVVKIIGIIGIIGLIAALTVPEALQRLERRRTTRTAATLRAIGTALGSYNVDWNLYPAGNAAAMFSVLRTQGYYSGTTQDGWGREFHYYSEDGTTYTLSSYGKDGKKGDGRDKYYDLDIIFSNGQFVAPPELVSY